MDQTKIGSFLKELRKEKNLSQEELAERFNVSSRSISRWENGNTMPDISIIIELADFYDVDIRELLNGERKSENMKEELKETLTMVADYTNAEKDKLSKQLITYQAGSAVYFGLLAIILVFHLTPASRASATAYGSALSFSPVSRAFWPFWPSCSHSELSAEREGGTQNEMSLLQ